MCRLSRADAVDRLLILSDDGVNMDIQELQFLATMVQSVGVLLEKLEVIGRVSHFSKTNVTKPDLSFCTMSQCPLFYTFYIL